MYATGTLLCMGLGDRVREARTARRLNQAALARQLGYKGHSMVSKIEADEVTPDAATIKRIAEITSRPLSFFTSEKTEYVNSALIEDSVPEDGAGYAELPYWGEVPAGDWQVPADVDGLTMEVEKALAKDGRIIVRVSGDSMSPKLEHRDVVIIQRSKTPKEGVITLARNDDNELALKVLRHGKDGEWELHPLNPSYPKATAKTWEILGYAVHVSRTDDLGLRP